MSDKNPIEIIKKKQIINGVFDRSASTYDGVGPRFFSYFGRRLANFANILPEANVLDVATGKGAVLFPAIESVGPKGNVIGIDLSEAMVRETSEELTRRSLKNVSVLRMDVDDLQFPDHSFDCVLCGFAIFFFPQLDRAFSEIHRVLKPAGRVTVSTWGKDDERWKWRDELIETWLTSDSKEQQSPKYLRSRLPIFEKPEELKSMMNEAGFSNAQVISEEVEFTYQNEEEWWRTQWSHGFRLSLEKIRSVAGEKGLARFKEEAFERLQTVKHANRIHQLFRVLFTTATKFQS